MALRLDVCSIRKNIFSPNYWLSYIGRVMFGWKKSGEEVENIKEYYDEEHTDVDYQDADVYVKSTGENIGKVTFRHERKWTERKERIIKVKWQNFSRTTPYTDNNKIVKCEKRSRRWEKVRNVLWAILIWLAWIALLAYVVTLGDGNKDLFQQVVGFLTWVAIFYLIACAINLLNVFIGKSLLSKSNFRKKQRVQLTERITQLDKDYNAGNIGRDAYYDNKNRLSTLLYYMN